MSRKSKRPETWEMRMSRLAREREAEARAEATEGHDPYDPEFDIPSTVDTTHGRPTA